MANIEDVEGIGPVNAAKLKEAGVGTVEKMLEFGASPAGRADLAAKTGLTNNMILEWVNRADLARVRGVGSEYADLLEAAGVDTVAELAQRNATNLAAKMSEINAAKNLVRRAPTESEVEAWIAHSKELPRVVTY